MKHVEDQPMDIFIWNKVDIITVSRYTVLFYFVICMRSGRLPQRMTCLNKVLNNNSYNTVILKNTDLLLIIIYIKIANNEIMTVKYYRQKEVDLYPPHQLDLGSQKS